MNKYGIKDKSEIKSYFQAINQDGTGKIKYSEFVAAELDESSYGSASKRGLRVHVCLSA